MKIKIIVDPSSCGMLPPGTEREAVCYPPTGMAYCFDNAGSIWGMTSEKYQPILEEKAPARIPAASSQSLKAFLGGDPASCSVMWKEEKK